MRGEWKHKILNVTKQGFEGLALELFRFQYEQNPVYKAYSDALKVKPDAVTCLNQVPFLPIGFFKTHEVKTGSFPAEEIFVSSGTTAMVNSRHFIKDINWYEQVFLRAFENFYGDSSGYCVLGLLPSYLGRNNSSLVYMVNRLIEKSHNLHSGFYLNEFDKLAEVLFEMEKSGRKVLLIGVTFALLDFAERKKLALKNTIVMETGGMKGRREEMIREDVHDILKKSFGVNSIHSEYGMTELLSQAYSKGEGVFNCPPWMKVLMRDDEDPLTVNTSGSGALNVIDLANMYSCSFIATDDIGKLNPDGSFEVRGRMNGSDLRGCSLLVV